MEKEQKDNSFMLKLATMIVDKRKGFYLVFILLIIFSLISMNKVKVNNDLTTYLSDDTETRRETLTCLRRQSEQYMGYTKERPGFALT